MTLALKTPKELSRAALVGLLAAIGTAIVTVPLFKSGLPPMPEAPSLAFAKTLFGPVPDPVGVIFHLLYVTGVTTAFLALAGARPSLSRIVGVSAVFYVLALAVFFPIVGWGFAGLAVTPKIAVAALVPHVLYGLLLWGADRVVFGTPRRHGYA